MRSAGAMRSVGILAVVLTALIAVASARADTTGEVTGTAVSSSGTPLGGVCVTAYPDPNTGGTASPAVETGSDGTYSIGELPSGTYAMSFGPCGGQNYAFQFYDGQPTIESAQLVTVVAGQTTSGIDATMAAGATITGTVIDQATGQPPLQNDIEVEAEIPGSSDANPYPAHAGEALVGTDGTYTLTGLGPGTYLIYFEALNAATSPFASAWYPDEPDPGHSTAVTVHPGETAVSLGVELAEAPGSVTGVVTDTQGAPVAGYGVAAGITEPDGSFYVPAGAQSGADGTYTITDLAPGTWTVDASPTGVISTGSYQKTAQAIVSAGAITPNVNFSFCVGSECPPTRLLSLSTSIHDHALLFAGTISDPSSAVQTVILRGRIGRRKITISNPNYFVQGGSFNYSMPLPHADWALHSGTLTLIFAPSDAATGGRFTARVPSVFPNTQLPRPKNKHKRKNKHKHKRKNKHKRSRKAIREGHPVSRTD